jgi:2-C-methyl-D-erythritol 4-phosphate cytidylyltransferase
LILAAYERATTDEFYGTDDASLVERMGIPVQMIPGDADNIKVTTPEDLERGEKIVCGREE